MTSSVLKNLFGGNCVELLWLCDDDEDGVEDVSIDVLLVSGPRCPTPRTGTRVGLATLLDGIHDCCTLETETLWGTLKMEMSGI